MKRMGRPLLGERELQRLISKDVNLLRPNMPDVRFYAGFLEYRCFTPAGK